MKYPNYVIHEAFLEQGVYTSSEHPQRGSYSIQDASWGINGKNVRVSSLENVPRNLPEGHRLLLAIRDVSVGLSDLDVDLSAHLDVSPRPFEVPKESHSYTTPPYTLGEVVWSVDAKSIDTELTGHTFIDLTDGIHSAPSFESASGLVFKWDAPTGNSASLVSAASNRRTSIPNVWIILKPFGDESSEHNGDA